MIDLISASAFVRLHRNQCFVIKVGGACLARRASLRALAQQIAVVEACGAKPVLVHGGGPQTDAIQRSLGEEPRKVDGRRVTSPEGLRALRLATGGELNADLTAALTAASTRAVGISAASGECVLARRRQPMTTSEGVVDFGEVGDVRQVNVGPIEALLEAGYVPVISPPAADGKGGFLNVNADSMAAEIAVALGAAKLVLMTSAPGVLTDPQDPSSLASTLTLAELAKLDKKGALVGGMNVKAVAARTALEGGVPRVHVVSGLESDALIGELYTTHGTGTLLTSEPESVPLEVLEEAKA